MVPVSHILNYGFGFDFRIHQRSNNTAQAGKKASSFYEYLSGSGMNHAPLIYQEFKAGPPLSFLLELWNAGEDAGGRRR